ncbi:MAG: sigma factor-like helix-turn-helix DNA-binding protein [Verrucomicrobiota bacterium]|nr:sigma factor-like helix-turn-helix DNA-binding protein [Verrucomicrobiota bacterium]
MDLKKGGGSESAFPILIFFLAADLRLRITPVKITKAKSAKSLKKDYREALFLKYVDGLSIEEIARVLN